MWKIANVVQFKRAVSWVSTVTILGVFANFAAAILFENNRGIRMAAGLVILLLAIIAKRAVHTFDAAPLRAILLIERVFYAAAATGLLAGGYVMWTEEALRSVPGLLLFLLNGVFGIGAFAVIKANIKRAKSFAPAENGD